MLSLTTRNVNTAYPELLIMLRELGVNQETRNGVARALPHPLLIEFRAPWERVIFDAKRNANPFFHLMESLWMLAGRNDTAFLDFYNKSFKQFSDDGKTFNAAYGFRWREYFGYDQINRVCEILKANPNDRRCVIAMWDGHDDLRGWSKDHPCNTQIMCRIVDGSLDFTITNRSNDVVWGLCGANAVHMSMLQEFMAAKIGVDIGRWYHLTNNLHIYEQHFELMDTAVALNDWTYPERRRTLWEATLFEQDCNELCDGGREFRTPFFSDVVQPMADAWACYKGGDVDDALLIAGGIAMADWREACGQWLLRAGLKRNAK